MMEVPVEVLVHNALLGAKGTQATLVRIADDGYYELILAFGDKKHRALLPVAQTVLIQRDSEEPLTAENLEIER